MKLTLDKKSLYQVFVGSIIFFGLDISYLKIIQPSFEYYGFYYIDTNLLFEVCCYLLSFILLLLAFISKDKLLDKFFLIFILLFLTFPSIILFKSGGAPRNIVISHLLFFFFVKTLIYFDVKFRLPKLKIKNLNSGSILFLTILISSIPFFILYKFNLNLDNLFLEDVYETRKVQGEKGNIITSHLYSPISKIIVPFGLIYFLEKKKTIFFMVFVLFGVYFYLIGAHKTVLIGNIICVFFYTINKKYFIDYLLYIIIGVLFLVFGIYYIYDDIFFSSLVIRRVFFIPALLDIYYFDFFKDLKMVYSHSILESFIPNKLGGSIPAAEIGYKYFSGGNANNGLISDGFMNLGYLGITLNFFIIGLFYILIRSLKLKNIYIGIPYLFFFSIVSSAPLTILLTHGGIFFILFSLLMYDTRK